jgi:hypothetical protein
MKLGAQGEYRVEMMCTDFVRLETWQKDQRAAVQMKLLCAETQTLETS